MKMSRRSGSGFTLIELSIVLVIIGLLVGGVLVGRDLIEAANIRAQVKQFEDYKLSLNSFKLKYNCLPGDCSSATDFSLGNNGNGNDVLELATIAVCSWINDNSYTTPDCGWNGELPLFFQHLSAAKMIKGVYNGSWGLGLGFPKVAINESVGIMASGAWHETISVQTIPNNLRGDYNFPSGFWLHAHICDPNASGDNNNRSLSNDNCGVFTTAQTHKIDTKIDDGKPLSGIFWGYTGYWSSTSVYCLNGAYTDYDLSTTDVICHAAYRMY